MKLESVISEPGFASGLYGPLFLSVWDTAATPDQARRAAGILASLGRSEDQILMMAVLGPNCPPPDNAVREIFAGEVNRLGSRIHAIANIVEGQGFRAAAMRAVLTGIALVIRGQAQQKACSTVLEGSQFISEHSAGRLSANEIGRAVIQLRLT